MVLQIWNWQIQVGENAHWLFGVNVHGPSFKNSFDFELAFIVLQIYWVLFTTSPHTFENDVTNRQILHSVASFKYKETSINLIIINIFVSLILEYLYAYAILTLLINLLNYSFINFEKIRIKETKKYSFLKNCLKSNIKISAPCPVFCLAFYVWSCKIIN